ncbi:hypothetical protein HanPI659440_Chr08g0297211 [Helianthus annuus]|nr:hypothetical protein HanPI659440_Chr08g0297211 [Helianthus annuus]
MTSPLGTAPITTPSPSPISITIDQFQYNFIKWRRINGTNFSKESGSSSGQAGGDSRGKGAL